MFNNLFEISKNNYVIIFLIIINFVIFNISSNFQINKFNKIPSNPGEFPKLLYSPVEMNMWNTAYEFKKNISFSSIQDYEFRHHFLPSKILGLYGKISNLDFYDKKGNINFKNIHSFFLFQTILYYLSVIYLYRKLKLLKINKLVIIFTTFFLLFEPTINQYRYTIFGETIFFSILIFLFSNLIDLPKKNINYLFLGLLFAFCYLQRSVAMFFIIVPVIIVLFKFKKNSLFKIFNLVLSYGSILLILGYINYNRSDNFYFFPTQTIDNLYNFFLPSIEMKNQNYNSVLEAKNVLMSKKLNFADKNNLDLNNESDRIIFYKWQREKAIEAILNNKLLTIQIALKSSLHSALLNPTEVLFTRIHGVGYYKSELHQKTLKYRVIYTLIVFFIIFLGFLYAIKNKIYSPHILLIAAMYFFSISSWVGYTRYFIPTYISLCLYFGLGIYYLYQLFNNPRINNK